MKSTFICLDQLFEEIYSFFGAGQENESVEHLMEKGYRYFVDRMN